MGNGLHTSSYRGSRDTSHELGILMMTTFQCSYDHACPYIATVDVMGEWTPEHQTALDGAWEMHIADDHTGHAEGCPANHGMRYLCMCTSSGRHAALALTVWTSHRAITRLMMEYD